MWPLTPRKQYGPTPEAKRVLNRIPGRFKDDGLSLFPDRWLGFDFRWAGRIHDWEYCTRCHAPGLLTRSWKTRADVRIGRNVSSAVPRRWKWLGPIVRTGVLEGGYRAFNSCGDEPYNASQDQLRRGLCRHDMPRPAWMRRPSVPRP